VPYVLDLLRKFDGPSSPAWLYAHLNPEKIIFPFRSGNEKLLHNRVLLVI